MKNKPKCYDKKYSTKEDLEICKKIIGQFAGRVEGIGFNSMTSDDCKRRDQHASYIAKMFRKKKSYLRGTVSQIVRTGAEIEDYFKYFNSTTIQGLKIAPNGHIIFNGDIIDKSARIYIFNSYVEQFNGEYNLTAEMTFIISLKGFNNKKNNLTRRIVSLDSNVIVDTSKVPPLLKCLDPKDSFEKNYGDQSWKIDRTFYKNIF